jgi:1-acyl-sn-glycerol-3-phosphate acyltransferase
VDVCLSRRRRLPVLVAGDPWLYAVARLVIVPLALTYGRIDFSGTGRLPAAGPALIVADHPSDLDPLLVAMLFPRTLRFLASLDHFDRPFVGWCMRRLATVPVDRDGGRDELGTPLGLLQRGEVVAVFPEGDIHAAGVRPFEDGIGYLAAKSGAPVLPIAISGADEMLRGSWWRQPPAGWTRRPRVRLAVGPPFCLVPTGDCAAASSHLGDLIAQLRSARGCEPQRV